MDETVDLDAIALATSGAVGSDLANMINEAATHWSTVIFFIKNQGESEHSSHGNDGDHDAIFLPGVVREKRAAF